MMINNYCVDFVYTKSIWKMVSLICIYFSSTITTMNKHLVWYLICETLTKLSFLGEEFAGWGKPGGYSLHREQVQVLGEFSWDVCWNKSWWFCQTIKSLDSLGLNWCWNSDVESLHNWFWLFLQARFPFVWIQSNFEHVGGDVGDGFAFR